jgi:chemotaxis methyl-accepting protein methylase
MEGIYPVGALAQVPAEARARFFMPAGRASFCVADELRKSIRWQVHDLTIDAPPARDFYLVFLRNNLLTYYRDEIVRIALPAIVDSLMPGGILVIGQKERLPDFRKGFDPHPAVSCLYRKQASGSMLPEVITGRTWG